MFSAVVTSFADIGYAIRNVDRPSGYMLAEGPSTLPAVLDNQFSVQAAEALTLATGQRWTPMPGTTQFAATVVLRKLDDNTTGVMLRLSPITIDGQYTRKFYATFPPRLNAEFAHMWTALELQIVEDGVRSDPVVNP